MFQLSQEEYDSLRSQIVTLKTGLGQHRKYLLYAFTKPGVAMLSGLLRSGPAILVNVEIMRVFVRLRRMLADNAELWPKLAALERKHDEQFNFRRHPRPDGE
ncbi:MAG: ORF6N domain-containing protein [Acidobacteriota bacterium]